MLLNIGWALGAGAGMLAQMYSEALQVLGAASQATLAAKHM